MTGENIRALLEVVIRPALLWLAVAAVALIVAAIVGLSACPAHAADFSVSIGTGTAYTLGDVVALSAAAEGETVQPRLWLAASAGLVIGESPLFPGEEPREVLGSSARLGLRWSLLDTRDAGLPARFFVGLAGEADGATFAPRAEGLPADAVVGYRPVVEFGWTFGPFSASAAWGLRSSVDVEYLELATAVRFCPRPWPAFYVGARESSSPLAGSETTWALGLSWGL